MEELKRHLQVVVNPQGAVSGELAGAIRSLDETLRTKGESMTPWIVIMIRLSFRGSWRA